ncbi:MAG: DNA polymerase III subunit gamma/tau [Candidatus Paceibacterota bacterium]
MTKTSTQDHIAFYRKYRPAHFDEVIGQEHIVSVLKESVARKSVGHAYLFAGSRGTGKTSVARILAKELLTDANDIYEIDAASNRGIDDVRALREAVTSLPFFSQFKVYIVDEVHMLTKEAFNALLKTLEEPPKHAIFILATTEIDKLPQTVVSRCQTFTFKKPTRSELVEVVKSVGKKEGYSVEESAAELIAILGNGAFRDTHGVLEQVVSGVSTKTITVLDVERITGAPKGELVNDIVGSIANRVIENGLNAIRKAGKQNIDMTLLTKLVTEKVRAVLLLRIAPNMREDILSDYTPEDGKFLSNLAESGKEINSKTLLALLEVHDFLGKGDVPELPLELALVKILEQNEKPEKK